MNSKIKVSLLLGVLFFSINANAQTESKSKEPQLVLYAIVGYKDVVFNNLYNKLDDSGISTPRGAFNLGAGVYYNHKSMIYGLDFYNSSASAANDKSKTKYNGFTNSLYLGYKAIDKNAIMLAPIIGVVSTSNIVSVYDKSFDGDIFEITNAYSLNNFDLSARLGIAFETIAPNGLAVGITTGYDFSMLGDSEWKIEGPDNNAGIQDSQGGFFVNLTLGGHLFLKKSNK